MMSTYRIIPFIAAVLLFASCSFAPKAEPAPFLSFAHLEPIPIAVQAVHTENISKGRVEDFVAVPEEVLLSYLDNRFTAVGQGDILLVMIEDTSVALTNIEAEQGIAKFLGVGGASHYDVRIKMRLEHRDEAGATLYGRVLSGRRRIKTSEHLSIAERERAQLKGLEALFAQLDESIQRIVRLEMNL